MFQTEWDYGLGLLASDLKPEKRLKFDGKYSSSYLKGIIKELQYYQPTKYKLAVCIELCGCDEDGDEYEFIEVIGLSTFESYNIESEKYSIEDLEKEILFIEKQEEDRRKILSATVVDQQKENGLGGEWSDGSFSQTITTFSNGWVFLDRSDNCPGASRSTQRLTNEKGNTVSHYTYCEDAGNSSGDHNLRRAFAQKANKGV